MVRLVTAGTGFIGRHLLRELARRDGSVEAAAMAYPMRGIHF
jgi:uncharacterized protein YbjT (DUF2867 family)